MNINQALCCLIESSVLCLRVLQVVECTAEEAARHRMTQALALTALLLVAPHRTTRKAVTSSSSSAQMVSELCSRVVSVYVLTMMFVDC